MAQSLSHTFGQIIGDLLELAIHPHLEEFAKVNNLYLDRKGVRKARSGKKLSWTDGKGNKHDLDYVLERDGTEDALGTPTAFIETAWRRYTKHSRNKAQEIQGAIIPLVERYRNSSPFIGAVLAGVFTAGSLAQLESHGFAVLYFPYESVIAAFGTSGIDASFDEGTSEEEFREKIERWRALENKNEVATELLRLNAENVRNFFVSLTTSITRHIEQIALLPLHGKKLVANTINEAIALLEDYVEDRESLPFIKYEIIVRYNNGDKIDANFLEKKDAIAFLATYS